MKYTRYLKLTLGLLLLAAAMPLSTLAAEPAEPVEQTATLVNPSFETFESSGMATGWASWVIEGSPTFQQITSSDDSRRVKEGSSAQMMTASNTNYRGGIQQTVYSVTAGQKYRFTIWAHAWASSGDDPTKSEGYTTINLKIGIGQGETYAGDPGIVWSEYQHYVDTYQQLSVEAVAQSNTITLFTYANPAVHLKHNDVYWDNAGLTQVTVTSTSVPVPTIGPTNTPLILPTDFLTPTPNAQGQIIYTVQPGDSIVHIATVVCGETPECVEKIKQMNNLTGNLITVGQRLIVGPLDGSAGPINTPTATQAVADGGEEPTAAAAEATATPESGGEEEPAEDVSEPTSAPVAEEPTESAAAGGEGSICITMYDDTNGNGILDAGEALIADGEFILRGALGNTLANYTTNGANEPYCFENLASATYQVTSIAPPGYAATTRTDWDLTLAAGSTATLEFGAQFTGEGEGGDDTGGEEQPTRSWLPALLGAGGVVLLLIALGIGVFLVMNRRK